MTYIEYCTSAGHGTLINHGVADADEAIPMDMEFLGVDWIVETITPERYREFIAIHGGERAV